jgi:adenylate cyclase
LLASEPDHGSAISFGVAALFTLGEIDRAREWIARALLLDPDNLNMRYNLACALLNEGKDVDGALDLLELVFSKVHEESVLWAKSDPDLDAVRALPRFKAMIAAAEARFAAERK